LDGARWQSLLTRSARSFEPALRPMQRSSQRQPAGGASLFESIEGRASARATKQHGKPATWRASVALTVLVALAVALALTGRAALDRTSTTSSPLPGFWSAGTEGCSPVPTRSCRSRPKPDPALADAIKRLRAEKGMTQEDLAHAAELTTAALARTERAEANPTWATVRRIARGLGVTMSELGAAADSG
jgi:DNA-binding XRE family transcriptional regulator